MGPHDEKAMQAAREALCTHRNIELAREICAGFPEEDFPRAATPRRILFDTGRGDTFQRLVHSRVEFAPGEDLERIEVAMPKRRSLGISFHHNTADYETVPPMISRVPTGSFGDSLGLRSGLLQQVLSHLSSIL